MVKDKEHRRKYMREYMNKKYKESKKFREYCHKRTNKYRNTKKGKKYVYEYNHRPKVKKRYDQWRLDHVEEQKKKKHKYYLGNKGKWNKK